MREWFFKAPWLMIGIAPFLLHAWRGIFVGVVVGLLLYAASLIVPHLRAHFTHTRFGGDRHAVAASHDPRP